MIRSKCSGEYDADYHVCGLALGDLQRPLYGLSLEDKNLEKALDGFRCILETRDGARVGLRGCHRSHQAADLSLRSASLDAVNVCCL